MRHPVPQVMLWQVVSRSGEIPQLMLWQVDSLHYESPYKQAAFSVPTVVIHMYDSLFHLDRLSTTVGEQVCSLDDIGQVCPLTEFENYMLKLTGATASFCDRETLPKPEDIAFLLRSGFKVMV